MAHGCEQCTKDQEDKEMGEVKKTAVRLSLLVAAIIAVGFYASSSLGVISEDEINTTVQSVSDFFSRSSHYAIETVIPSSLYALQQIFMFGTFGLLGVWFWWLLANFVHHAQPVRQKA